LILKGNSGFATIPISIAGQGMITIKCAKCNRKIFKYLKIGKGRVWHCWKDRISKDHSIRDGNAVRCPCGNLIGVEQGKWIKMKQNSFIYSGTKVKK